MDPYVFYSYYSAVCTFIITLILFILVIGALLWFIDNRLSAYLRSINLFTDILIYLSKKNKKEE